MKTRSQVKQGKLSALVGIIVGVVFLIFGIVFLITIQSELSYNDSSGIMTDLFFACFITVIGIIIFINIRSLSRNNAPSMLDIETETLDTPSETIFPIETKLKQLEKLKKEDLISEAEYVQKRNEIMQSKW